MPRNFGRNLNTAKLFPFSDGVSPCLRHHWYAEARRYRRPTCRVASVAKDRDVQGVER